MIQGVINRLAGHSFQVKGWSVMLLSALFAFSVKDADKTIPFLAYIPATAFWFLDGYFLSQERRFRCLYEKVRQLDEQSIDFSMDPGGSSNETTTWKSATLSRTLWVFHASLLVTPLLVILLLKFAGD